MAGPIALHGGGEFLPGDERFLDALLGVAVAAVAARAPDVSAHAFGDDALETGPSAPIRVVVVPTAAARGRPDLAGANGVHAFRRRGEAAGCAVRAFVASVVDEASANDPALAGLIASADLVYLPGGDPDIIPVLLRESAAGSAVRAAHDSGAAIAGASAGAMALAEWTWTPAGGIPGLAFVRGLAVFPHYDEARRESWQASLSRIAPPGIAYLGIDERTGVISGADGWRVAGEGAAYWFGPGATSPAVYTDGESLPLAPAGD
jgi:cyanophycinase-like exopeptidase